MFKKSDFNLRQNRNNNANAIQIELKTDRINRAETYSYHPSPQCTPKEKSWRPRILIGETSSCSVRMYEPFDVEVVRMYVCVLSGHLQKFL